MDTQAPGHVREGPLDMERPVSGSRISGVTPVVDQADVASSSNWMARISRREEMLSFENTLRRCHSTVWRLRNSWAPISGFVSPLPAGRAIWGSRGGGDEGVATMWLGTLPPVGWNSPRARSGSASAPQRRD